MRDLFSVLLKGLYFFIVFGIILLLAYYITKVVGKRVSGNRGKYMGIIDTLYLGGDKNLIIVKVKDAYLLMSSSNRGIEFLKELNDFVEDAGAETSFKGYLRDYSTQKYNISGLLGLFRKQKGDGDGTDE